MNSEHISHIRELADILSKNGLTSIQISEGSLMIRLEKNAAPVLTTGIAGNCSAGEEETVSIDGKLVNFEKLSEVKSPMVGVFYTSPSPDSEPFVTIGSKVKKGDILCIIEAMKLMNEIHAEEDGEIIDICLKNGGVVEYGQTLFKLVKAL